MGTLRKGQPEGTREGFAEESELELGFFFVLLLSRNSGKNNVRIRGKQINTFLVDKGGEISKGGGERVAKSGG